jgi:hypothetical protein
VFLLAIRRAREYLRDRVARGLAARPESAGYDVASPSPFQGAHPTYPFVAPTSAARRPFRPHSGVPDRPGPSSFCPLAGFSQRSIRRNVFSDIRASGPDCFYVSTASTPSLVTGANCYGWGRETPRTISFGNILSWCEVLISRTLKGT